MLIVEELLSESLGENWEDYNDTTKANVVATILKEDPFLEIWETVKYHKARKPGQPPIRDEVVEEEGLLISSFGRVVNGEDLGDITPRLGKDGIPYFNTPPDQEPFTFKLDRAIACRFVKVPQELVNIRLQNLQVRHKDGNLENCVHENLEWFLPLP